MSVQTDSRLVKPGDTFVAVRGAASDGARFVPQAIAAGAARIVSEEAPPPDLPAGVEWERVPDSRAAAAALACEDAGHPSRRLSVVGVTGTNGKTTIANLVRRALEGCGVPCGLLSTIENDVRPLASSAPVPAHNTTPGPVELQGRVYACRNSLQFFTIPIGMLLGGWMLWASVRRSLSDWVLLPIALIPFVLLGASLSDNAVYLEHGIIVPLSRSFKAPIKEHLNGLSGKRDNYFKE